MGITPDMHKEEMKIEKMNAIRDRVRSRKEFREATINKNTPGATEAISINNIRDTDMTKLQNGSENVNSSLKAALKQRKPPFAEMGLS